jgi:SAM-dependent methyltransferase
VDVYSERFYSTSWLRASRSARRVVPILLDLVAPRSVLDVGCGTGAWLEVFREAGVSDVLGVDGPHVKPDLMRIPPALFLTQDLAAPLRVPRRFDLAISLEVAEHLPPEAAERFVRDLTARAPVVLFSAAVPRQGGTRHINERWPEYWEALFRGQAYVVVDCLRPRIWNDEEVEFFYAQNALLFIEQGRLDRYPALKAEEARRRGEPLSRIHPRAWMRAHDPRVQPLSSLLRAVWITARHRLRHPR